MNYLSEAKVKIRKERLCFGCLKKYPVGTEMHRASFADEGTVYSIYECVVCNHAAKSIQFDEGIRYEGWFNDELEYRKDFKDILKLYV